MIGMLLPPIVGPGADLTDPIAGAALDRNLRAMERARERYWRSYPQSSPYKFKMARSYRPP